jgi:hypothetical protein
VAVRASDIVTYAVVGLCAAAAAVIGGVVVFAEHGIRHPAPLVLPHVTGRLDASGGRLGTWTLAPDACVFGEVTGVDHGVWLFHQGDRVHGIAISRDQGNVALAAPAQTNDIPTRFARVDCSVFEVDLARGDREPGSNERFYWHGKLHIDCARGDERARAELAFDHCY